MSWMNSQNNREHQLLMKRIENLEQRVQEIGTILVSAAELNVKCIDMIKSLSELIRQKGNSQ